MNWYKCHCVTCNTVKSNFTQQTRRTFYKKRLQEFVHSQSHTGLQWHCDVLSPVTLDNSPPPSLQLSHNWSVQRFLFYPVTHILKTTKNKKHPVNIIWQAVWSVVLNDNIIALFK